MDDAAAVANTEQQRKRRKGVAKSKTGCLTCRIRHVKCDESKPSCRRCTSTGRLCDYVSPAKDSLHSLQLVSSRKPPKSNFLVTASKANSQLLPKPVHSPSSHLLVLEVDHLEYFHLLCSKSFSGYLGDSLWNKTVFQMSNSEPCIRNAIVSLATLVRHQNSVLHHVDRQESEVNYVKALQALNRRLDGSSLSRELALICSLLFAAFEALGGRDMPALQHLWAGFAMLKEHSSKCANPSDNLRELANAFSSFDLQASTFASFYEPKSSPIPHVPPRFTGIEQARDIFNNVLAYMHQLFKPQRETQRTLPYTPPPANISKGITQVKSLLSDWMATFNNFLTEAMPRPSPIAVQILQLQHITASIFVSTFLYRDQLAFDAFNADFTRLVTLASSVVETSMAHSDGRFPSFSFEVGIIQPLYFTACRCRNSVLRRRAISLLENSGIEGLWDGKAMAAAARWVVEMEEGEGNSEKDDGFVPEAARLRGVGIEIDRRARRKRIRLVSSRRNEDGGLSFVSGNVGWGESAGVEIEDAPGLVALVKEWQEHVVATH